jgi:hypothetical protein
MNQTTMFDLTAPTPYDNTPLPQALPEKGEERADERNRRATQRDKILSLLREGNVTNFELADVCIRYSARIHELRKAGHVIETVTKIPGKDKSSTVVLYRLKEGT